MIRYNDPQPVSISFGPETRFKEIVEKIAGQNKKQGTWVRHMCRKGRYNGVGDFSTVSRHLKQSAPIQSKGLRIFSIKNRPISRNVRKNRMNQNNFTFYTPIHPVWRRCETSEYQDIPAFSRLARRAPQRLKL